MKHVTIKKIQDLFVGKVCTILTSTIAKTNFPDTQFAEFFTGIVESIDEDGIITRHHLTGCYNFYNWQFVVGIIEEQIIKETDPEFKKIVQEVKTMPAQSLDNVLPVNPEAKPDQSFIDTNFMKDLASKFKNSSSMIRKQ